MKKSGFPLSNGYSGGLLISSVVLMLNFADIPYRILLSRKWTLGYRLMVSPSVRSVLLEEWFGLSGWCGIEETTVWDALAKGLDDLLDLCTIVEQKFVAARNEFMADTMQDWEGDIEVCVPGRITPYQGSLPAQLYSCDSRKISRWARKPCRWSWQRRAALAREAIEHQ